MLRCETAIAGGFLQRRTRRLDKEENRFEKPLRTAKRMARDDNARAAMAFALVIKGELDFRSNAEGPLGHDADTLGRPLDLLFYETN